MASAGLCASSLRTTIMPVAQATSPKPRTSKGNSTSSTGIALHVQRDHGARDADRARAGETVHGPRRSHTQLVADQIGDQCRIAWVVVLEPRIALASDVSADVTCSVIKRGPALNHQRRRRAAQREGGQQQDDLRQPAAAPAHPAA